MMPTAPQATPAPATPRPRHPRWIRAHAPSGEAYARLKGLVRGLQLHTVCEEALCPNIGECWSAGTATIMILGDTCTRACRFCAVRTGNPGGTVDAAEPARVADAMAQLNLNHVVITSVDRDDLPDGGAAIFAETVRLIRAAAPRTRVEVLTPDFGGVAMHIEQVVRAEPHVFGQNLETVRRLSPIVRDRRAGYDLTLGVLRLIKNLAPRLHTKSSLLLGLGERPEEVLETMQDLRNAHVDFLAIGQYLQPAAHRRHFPLAEYITPEQFASYHASGMEMGFRHIAAGPMVRSSYKAWEAGLLDDSPEPAQP